MRQVTHLLNALLLVLSGTSAAANSEQPPLIIAYDSYIVEPYVFLQDNQVVAGVYWDLARLISASLDYPVTFQRVPRKRLEQFLAAGRAHLMLFGHPSWMLEPDKLYWTSRLTTEYDILVQAHSNTFPVHNLEDLSGKKIGTILGYHYPGFDAEPHQSSIFRDDAKDIKANFKRLATGRIDALLDSNILIEYFLKAHKAHHRFHVVDTWHIAYEIASGVSPKSPISAAQLSQIYRELNAAGKIDAVIAKYAPQRTATGPTEH